MSVARFLQVSDLHLGRPFAWLPQDRREDRRRDQQRALEMAVSQAIERGAHALLIPGDLFDSTAVEAGLLTFAIRAFEVNGCPPVFIAPGNHDPVSSANAAFHPRLLRARGMRWPEHVHVFDTPEWTSVAIAKLPGVRAWGRCFAASIVSTDRPLSPAALAPFAGADSTGFDIAVFHGSREGQCPPGQQSTAPFSDAEVAVSPFAYHAVGHYHSMSRIEQPLAEGVKSAGARLAYAGSAISLDCTETGTHGALEVRVEYGHRLPFVEVEPIVLDRRTVHPVAVDVTGAANADQVDRQILKALDQVDASEADFAAIRLTGRLGPGVRLRGPGADLRARVFYARTDSSALRPDHDLAAYRASGGRTTEERFALELMGQLDSETDPDKRRVIEQALYYGLDAFRLREVLPTYDEVSA